MGLLTRDSILGVDDIITQDIEVPEWGGTVRIKALNGKERDQFEAMMAPDPRQKKKVEMPANFRAKFLVNCIIDEEGKTIFSYKDVQALGNKSASALNRVFEAARKLAGLGTDDIEELEGNFTQGQNGGSTSN